MTTRTVLLIGASGGIGQAILQLLLKGVNGLQANPIHIFATYHRRMPSDIDKHANVTWLKVDLTDEQSIKTAIDTVANKTEHINWVINAAGVLHTEGRSPEKSIGQLDPEFFMQNMRINTLPSLLLAKHLKPLLKRRERSEATPALFATLSARVGSITDNKVGGWYSYRMSKAALNMGLKTLSIEWQRSLKNVCVIAIQPGTVDTALSKPYQDGVPEGGLFSATIAAQHIVKVFESLTANDTGRFVDWAGQSIDW